MDEHVWELRKDNTLLGTLTLKDQDMFWFTCDFAAAPAFEPYRALFVQDAQLLDHDPDATDTSEILYAQIGELNLALHTDNTFDDDNVFWLHISGEEASFRALNSPWAGGWVDKPLNSEA